jgi:hypothetical protein
MSSIRRAARRRCRPPQCTLLQNRIADDPMEYGAIRRVSSTGCVTRVSGVRQPVFLRGAGRVRSRQVDLKLPDATVQLTSDAGCSRPTRSTPEPAPSSGGPTPPNTVRTALDLGCGCRPARGSSPASAKATVWGVDVNPRAVDLCRAAADLGSPTCLPWPTNRPHHRVRPDLVESADPHRQGGPARPARSMDRSAPARRSRLPRGSQAPRIRLAPAMVVRLGRQRLTSRSGYRILDLIKPASADDVTKVNEP